MDDCLVHSKKEDHMSHLINLFKALVREWIENISKEMQTFQN